MAAGCALFVVSKIAEESGQSGALPVVLAVGASVFMHERMDAVGWVALAGSTVGAAQTPRQAGIAPLLCAIARRPRVPE